MNDFDKKTRKMQPRIYMGIGIALGVAVGASIDNLGIGIGIGVVIGALIDSYRANKYKKQ